MVADGFVDEGFIVLYRAMMESWLWRLSPSDFKIAVACIFLANWEDRKWFDGKKLMTIPRGSFVSSTEKLAKKCGKGITRKMIRGALSRLEVAEFLILGTRKGQAYTVVTIVNYEEYQKVRRKMGQDEGQARAKQGPGEGHNITIKPFNQDSMSEVSPSDGDGKKKKPKTPPPDLALRCADYLRKRILDKDPDHRLSHTFTDSQRENWARALDLLNRKDGKSWQEIGKVIDWLHDAPNTFVVLSASSLREKFENVRAAVKASKGPEYINGQRKLPPPKPPPPQPARPGETREQWEARMTREREEKEREENE